MKYYYEPSEGSYGAGETYICDHPLYNRCTLFRQGWLGLAVIQEHYDERSKARQWGPIAPRLAYDIYINANFMNYFAENASEADEKGVYPTVPVRKIMWALRMKPLKRENWEKLSNQFGS